MEPLSLEVEGLSHRWPGAERDTPASLSLRLEPGARGLLLGPNGAGKSTLFLRLVGLLDGPGEVRVGGTRLERRTRREIRRRVGLLWQRPDDGLLLPTVREDVALGPANDGRRAESLAIADCWLDRLGIAHLATRRIRELSVGERQLVALAGVLARSPGVVLLDEPASALDERARARLAALLADLPATLLLSTHDPAPWLAGPGGWVRAVELA
ncbi:MAG: energy-coupling factor ABC transporter ATP-binding protein [Thermoanaerobaculia bacterium]|nr:energy-coupling factor ABC transporter ATP-binding protein [Thermoanaerobaculia bacterium]